MAVPSIRIDLSLQELVLEESGNIPVSYTHLTLPTKA